MTKILSVGGSIIVPEKPDTIFLSEFVSMCISWLKSDKNNLDNHLLQSINIKISTTVLF